MQESNELKAVTIRIQKEDQAIIQEAMQETGNHTASKAIMQILRSTIRLMDTNRRLLQENEKLRNEMEQIKKNADTVRMAIGEIKNQMILCDKISQELEELDFNIEKRNKPPKGWGRK